jgi:diadenylate cyclase
LGRWIFLDVVPASSDETSFSSLLASPNFLPSIRENTVVFCKIVAPVDVQPVDRPWPDVEVNISLGAK